MNCSAQSRIHQAEKKRRREGERLTCYKNKLSEYEKGKERRRNRKTRVVDGGWKEKRKFKLIFYFMYRIMLPFLIFFERAPHILSLCLFYQPLCYFFVLVISKNRNVALAFYMLLGNMNNKKVNLFFFMGTKSNKRRTVQLSCIF